MEAKDDHKSDEDLIREFTESKDDYLSLDKDRLILIVIDYLNSKNIETTFDKLTVAAFKLFPKKFSLIGFPEYPDAKKELEPLKSEVEASLQKKIIINTKNNT
jgi:hypothetical protein